MVSGRCGCQESCRSDVSEWRRDRWLGIWIEEGLVKCLGKLHRKLCNYVDSAKK